MRMPNAATATTAACRVWARRSSLSSSLSSDPPWFDPCRFGTSVYDTVASHRLGRVGNSTDASTPRGRRRHCDRMLVDLGEAERAGVFLSPSESGAAEAAKTAADTKTATDTNTETPAPRTHRGIPFGRARDCPTLTPRARDDARLDRRRRPLVRLAVVGMVVGDETRKNSNDDDNDGVLLLTRRPRYMRSFPGAFVFPGGNIDEGESLVEAVSREIEEETGLAIASDSWELECLWESIYPTELPEEDDESRERGSSDGAIRAHHLVCYFSSKLAQRKHEKQRLRLCREEVDGAVWLSRCDIERLLEAPVGAAEHGAGANAHQSPGVLDELQKIDLALHTPSVATGENDERTTTTIQESNPTSVIPLSDLAGIYPRRDDTEDRWCGMAQGSLFALEEFVKKHYSS